MQNILALKSICKNFIFVYPKYTHCGFVLQKKKRKPGRIDKSIRSITFRFYGIPEKEQEQKLLCTIGSARFIWNAMLADAIDSKEKTGVYEVNGYAAYKKDNPWLNDIDSIALANANMNLNKAFDDYREGNKRRPRFKKKHICKASYTTNVSNKKKPNLRLEGDMLILPKVGKVKLCMHREVPENAILKNCTVTHEPDGKWMFSLTFEAEYTEYITPAMEKFFETGKASDIKHIGLDMSLPELYIDSDGYAPSYYNKRIISFSKYYHKLERRIAKEQRRLSRMVRDSANYRKQCIKIARLHAKAKHQREDFLHQISSRLAREYDLISIEDLDIRAIKKALSFGKSVSDNGWGNFVRMLEYKCEREGSFLIRVDKWFPSSKTCSKCGHIHHELKLSDRSYICPECGNVIDRDVQAAKNIDNEGLRLLNAAIGRNPEGSLLSYGADVDNPSHNMSAG